MCEKKKRQINKTINKRLRSINIIIMLLVIKNLIFLWLNEFKCTAFNSLPNIIFIAFFCDVSRMDHRI